MRLLLDTHVLLWWLEDNAKLGPEASEIIESGGNDLIYSVASPWEMAIKIGQGKLRVDIADALRSFTGAGFRRLDIEPPHLVTLVALERLNGDPFDRLIVAQALSTGLTIMTTDGAIRRYPVRTIGCR